MFEEQEKKTTSFLNDKGKGSILLELNYAFQCNKFSFLSS